MLMKYQKLQSEIRRTARECPHCGARDIYAGHQSSDTQIVACMVCKSSGPPMTLPDRNPKGLSIEDLECKLLQQAADGWNKRYTTPERTVI